MGQKMIFAGSQTAAGQCLIWVRSGRAALKFWCPLYPRKRTSL